MARLHGRVPHDDRKLCRRGFLAAVAAVPVLAAAPRVASAAAAPRTLRFTHTHTGERLAVEYFRAGEYLADALTAVNQLLRDFRTGDVHPIDPPLLDLLAELATVTGTAKPFDVISGYRSPATNGALRARSHGVASGSLHMTGQAIDVRLADVTLARLRDAALLLGRGGVGYYPTPQFVHLDTGRVRSW
jgi:uncharacterized protein YcbK (DUF882 family)